MNGCGQCGELADLCLNCHKCPDHCGCGFSIPADLFDADELGLDPESDNTPSAGERHA